MSCPQCAAPIKSPESRFCDRCGAALTGAASPEPLSCEVCGRKYKTERGLQAHVAAQHAGRESAPFAPPVAENPDDVRTPWIAPAVELPPRPVPGTTAADLATAATSPSEQAADLPAPPPAFRYSAPAGGADSQATAPQPVPPEGYGPVSARPAFLPISGMAGLINLAVVGVVLALLVELAANVYLRAVIPPDIDQLDLFVDIDEAVWVPWLVAAVFGALAYGVMVAWLYRAYRNQLALDVPETSMPPSVLAVLCFVPVVNLVVITLAVREIWRTADLEYRQYGEVRRAKLPGRLSLAWLGPLLAVGVWIAFAVFVRSKVGDDGVTSIGDAEILYVARAVLVANLIWIVVAIRGVFAMVTDRQERAHWHQTLGRGVAAPARAPSPRDSSPPPPPPPPASSQPPSGVSAY